ncbi:UDP-N-acetylmuramoyl-L-alanine--D-glutamate ligase [uncultured Ilyobacter sp.]|uniref:UDP-N-acetylmuramoyl-L-alanine--D-glutamate ligase n=1 Tax=uncultured Ilyobacter sp. TaxID=544433 RepID=UPI0029F5C843|nr:UDP-N-acetylmuramoyl-L-alanine--D-glutamate ligase [uncultured Ilyobacter sp.]
MNKALVFGAGISGLGAKKLLEKNGYKVVLVDDKKAMSSEEGMNTLPGVDLFIKSPGVPYTELVKKAFELNIPVIDEVELAYRYMKKKVKHPRLIAVTGTNGKTTTTTKIKELIQYSGYRCEFAGNIGRSFADLVAEDADLDYIVLELSSYQLENVKEFRPDIAMVINLAPDHLDRYEKAEDYYDTKFNIAVRQEVGDYFITNMNCQESSKRLDKINADILKVSLDGGSGCDLYPKGGWVVYNGKNIICEKKLSLKGRHNLENILFIGAVAEIIGLDEEKLREFLYNTGTLEHRMERFLEVGDTIFINDSKGTNIESSKMAIEAYHGCILICGGVDKKLDLKPLVDAIKSHVSTVYLIGELAEKLEQELVQGGYPEAKIIRAGNLENSVSLIQKTIDVCEKNNILLSPATASFDQFKNFEARGKIFKELVKKYFTAGEKI